MFENEEVISSIVMYKDDSNGEFHLNGLISDDIVLKSRKSHRSKREAKENSAELCPSCLPLAEHFVVKETKGKVVQDSLNQDTENAAETVFTTRQSRQLPSTMYAELLVYVDYAFYKKMRSHTKIKRYIVSYINAVNLRFKQFSEPNIELSIAGIVIGQSRSSLPFVSKNLVKRTYLDAPSCLHSMGKHFFTTR